MLEGGVEPCVPDLVNSLGMELVLIPPGRFLMGSPFSEPYHSPDEGPVHEVTLTEPFYLGRFPVTQREYREVTGLRPSHFAPDGPLPYYRLTDVNTARFPVDSVDFADAVAFCERLSALPAGAAGPAASTGCRRRRSGSTPAGPAPRRRSHFGESLVVATRRTSTATTPTAAAGRGRTCSGTLPGGRVPAERLGAVRHARQRLGVVRRLVRRHVLSAQPEVRPGRAAGGGESRVLRGGSWIDASWHCRSADRSHREALHYVGFRVAMTLS